MLYFQSERMLLWERKKIVIMSGLKLVHGLGQNQPHQEATGKIGEGKIFAAPYAVKKRSKQTINF